MKISKFKISDDRTKLELTISDAASVTALRLWTDETFKDFSKAVDLTARLTGSTTENINITLADIGIEYFDGLYFIEAEDSDEISLEYVYELSRFKECILDRIMYLNPKEGCLDEKSIDLINAHSFLKGLEYALEQRFIDEILFLNEQLEKYCDNTCTTCGKYKNVTNNTSEDILNPNNVIIRLDGGSLD